MLAKGLLDFLDGILESIRLSWFLTGFFVGLGFDHNVGNVCLKSLKVRSCNVLDFGRDNARKFLCEIAGGGVDS